jgi:hypothetical protein
MCNLKDIPQPQQSRVTRASVFSPSCQLSRHSGAQKRSRLLILFFEGAERGGAGNAFPFDPDLEHLRFRSVG